MYIVDVLTLSGIVMWVVLFAYGCKDMYRTYRRIHLYGENEPVSWPVDNYGTSLGDEYGEGEL